MTKTRFNFFEVLLFFTLIIFAILLALGSLNKNTVLDGINLWATCVLPALFPYFFITAILSRLSLTYRIGTRLSPITKRLFNTGGLTGYAFLMSVISGYPVGAQITAQLKKDGLISSAEAIRCSALCSTSSPLFLMGSVGNIMFKNSYFGLLLFLCHLASATINGFIFSFYKRNERPVNFPPLLTATKTDNLLYEGVYSAVISILTVGGLITIFYLLTELLVGYKILTPLINSLTSFTGDKTISQGIAFGLFECTKGLKTIAGSNINFFTLPTVAFICGFGGLSVLAQSIAFLKSAKIKTAPFVLSKLSGAVINFLIGIIFSAFLL